MVRLLLGAALGGAHVAFALGLFLLELLAPGPLDRLLGLLGDQLALGLDVLAEADFAHRERGVHAGVLAADAQALIDLEAFAVAFLHLDVHAHRIAGLEARHRPLSLHLVHRRLADRIENVHRIHPFVTSLRSLRSAGGPTDRAAVAA